MKKLSLKASFLCGSIKLKTQGYHRNIQNCHCVQCVKTHGNYAAYTYVEEKNINYPQKSKAMNLAFDITPAKYVTGLITEKGVCEASEKGLKGLFNG